MWITTIKLGVLILCLPVAVPVALGTHPGTHCPMKVFSTFRILCTGAPSEPTATLLSVSRATCSLISVMKDSFALPLDNFVVYDDTPPSCSSGGAYALALVGPEAAAE
jgi:hypothetical protein